jgi:DNA repair protein RecO (recombination protein O)
MEERATGIILRTHPLTETSLIVRWLTADAGRIDTAARGARRAKSPMRGKLDLFYLAQFSFARNRRSELHTLREVSLLDTHRPLRNGLGALRQASYASALIVRTTEPGTPLPELFALMKGFLSRLALAGPAPSLLLAFEINMLMALGQQPPLTDSGLSKSARHLFESCENLDWTNHHWEQPPMDDWRELAQFLFRWLSYHVGGVPRERASALDMATEA